jgi:RecJ-like exonuclease
MNLVVENGKVLSTKELFGKMCEVSPTLRNRIKAEDVDAFVTGRIDCAICRCNGYGVFKLFPADAEIVQEGGKRYMQCMICGKYSHL